MSEKQLTQQELSRKIQTEILNTINNDEYAKIYKQNPQNFVESFVRALTELTVKQLVAIDFTKEELTEYYTEIIASNLFSQTIKAYEEHNKKNDSKHV